MTPEPAVTLNIHAVCEPVDSPRELAALREQHLDGLAAAQDALLELFVASGRHYRLRIKGAEAGYCVVHDGAVLVEFHLTRGYDVHGHQLLPQVVATLGIRAALIKTFDHVFLANALDIACQVRVRGMLVRDMRLATLPKISRIHYTRRTAAPDDLWRVLAVDQDVFTQPDRMYAVVARGELELFERDGHLIGFGILRPVIRGRPDVEVGIAVDRAFRNKGYAVYMLRELIDVCLQRGLNPICGSARSNEASIRMGARIGFMSRYRLIEVQFREPGSAS